MEWGKKCHRDQGQENDCSAGCTEGRTLCFIVSISGRMETFHTCARDTVEVVVNKQEVNSLRGILCVCVGHLGKCVWKQGAEKTWIAAKSIINSCFCFVVLYCSSRLWLLKFLETLYWHILAILVCFFFRQNTGTVTHLLLRSAGCTYWSLCTSRLMHASLWKITAGPKAYS